jgi:hypothetical protein
MEKRDLKAIRDEINDYLKLIGTKYNVSIKTVGNTTYDSCSFRMRIEGVKTDANGVSEKDRLDFNRGCKIVGLNPEDFGKEFVSRGVRYKITGLKLNRPTYPICVERVKDGRSLKFREIAIKNLLGK